MRHRQNFLLNSFSPLMVQGLVQSTMNKLDLVRDLDVMNTFNNKNVSPSKLFQQQKLMLSLQFGTSSQLITMDLSLKEGVETTPHCKRTESICLSCLTCIYKHRIHGLTYDIFIITASSHGNQKKVTIQKKKVKQWVDIHGIYHELHHLEAAGLTDWCWTYRLWNWLNENLIVAPPRGWQLISLILTFLMPIWCGICSIFVTWCHFPHNQNASIWKPRGRSRFQMISMIHLQNFCCSSLQLWALLV